MSSDDYHSQRLSASRFEIVSMKDNEGMQYAEVKGMDGEHFDKVMRIQPHGLSSHSPAGAHHVGVRLGHRSDTLALMGGEHADKRPRDIGEGNTALYNADGTIWKLIGKNSVHTADSCTITCGGTTFKIDKDGVTITGKVNITGGTLKHNDKDIGSTHKHRGVRTGADNTDVPV